MRNQFKKPGRKIGKMPLYTVVLVKKTEDGYDVNIRNDRNDYIDMCRGVPANVLFDCMFAEDINYMLNRDLDECGYFAIIRPNRDRIRRSAKEYTSKKYDYIKVDFEGDWE